jgi:hypothetical protein
MSLLAGLREQKEKLNKVTPVVRQLFDIGSSTSGTASGHVVLSDGTERKQPRVAHSVLIISKYTFAFDQWISRKHTKVLITSNATKDALPFRYFAFS